VKAGWDTKTLAEVCTVFADGDWIESKDQSTDGIRLIQTGNVGEGEFKDRSDKARYISEETFARLRCTEIFEGDCLISRLPDPVGRSAILPDTGERMITAVDCTIVRFDQTLCLPEFFNYYSQSTEYISNIADRCTGTTRNRISRSQLGNTPVPTPPVQEQRRIVTLLDEAFANIATAKANAEKNLQNARDLYRAFAAQIFSDHAKDWSVQTLDELAVNLDSKRVPITKSDRKQGEYPYYGASGIVDYVDGYIFEGDTLLISEDGANLLARSTPIAFPASGRYWVNNHAHILQFNSMSTQKFVELYLESIPLDGYITGAAQPKLNQKTLNSIPIPIPDSTVDQQLIVDQLVAMQAQCEQLASSQKQKLTALDDLKKSLLHHAFSGLL